MKTDPKEAAIKLLRQCSVIKPPVPLEKLVECLKLKLIHTDMDADMSGALVRMTDGDEPLIVVNEAHPRNRQRFTIAHEIGHHLLGHLTGPSHIDREFTVIHRDQLSSQATDSREVAANTFAANLLMPEEFLLKDFVRLGGFTEADISDMAIRYKVSEQALRIRLGALGFLPPY